MPQRAPKWLAGIMGLTLGFVLLAPRPASGAILTPAPTPTLALLDKLPKSGRVHVFIKLTLRRRAAARARPHGDVPCGQRRLIRLGHVCRPALYRFIRTAPMRCPTAAAWCPTYVLVQKDRHLALQQLHLHLPADYVLVAAEPRVYILFQSHNQASAFVEPSPTRHNRDLNFRARTRAWLASSLPSRGLTSLPTGATVIAV